MRERGPWQGMGDVFRFNWPMYAAAGVVLAAALAGAWLAASVAVKIFCALVAAGCVWLLLGSLGVSHLVYDRSDLYRWNWLGRAMEGAAPRRFILCHAGYDEASRLLKERFPQSEWRVLDHYDAATMTEPSIHRARRRYPPTADTLAAKFDVWPIESAAESDVVFGLLAIHELRAHEDRAAWFAEARRCLAGEGRVIVVEHVRDTANFLAFGPGFLHFHSVATWRRSWEASGFRLADHFRLTPFLRVFVLK